LNVDNLLLVFVLSVQEIPSFIYGS